MDDLIGLIAFMVIATINLLAQAHKKKKQKERLEGEEAPPEREPTPFETFFDDLAEKFEPKPTSLPDWPEAIERPDYVQEMEEFNPEPVFEKHPEPIETPIAAVPAPRIIEQVAGIKTPAMVSSSVFSGSGLMRLPSVPLMRSQSSGHIDFELRDRRKLKQAIVASMVFGQPRAYDCSFDNTIAK